MSSSEHEDRSKEDGIRAPAPGADPVTGIPPAATAPPTRRDFVRTIGKFMFVATIVDLMPTEPTARASEPCAPGNPDAGCATNHKDGNCTPTGDTEDQSCGWLRTRDEHCGELIPAGADPDDYCGGPTGDPSKPEGDSDQSCGLSIGGSLMDDANCGVDYFGGAQDSDCGKQAQGDPIEPDNYCTGSGNTEIRDQACKPELNSPDQNCTSMETDETCGAEPYPGAVNGPDEVCGETTTAGLQPDGACSWRDKDQSCHTFVESPTDESCGAAWVDQNCSKQTQTSPGDVDQSCGTYFTPSGETTDRSCCQSSPGDGADTDDQTDPIYT
jgi:hypothetical protein